MGLSRRKFTREFKLGAIEQRVSGASMTAVARALELSPSLLLRWQKEFLESPATAFPGAGQRRLDADRVAQLEWKICQHRLEIDFFEG